MSHFNIFKPINIMKLPLKLNIPSEGDIGGSKDCYLINWLKSYQNLIIQQ